MKVKFSEVQKNFDKIINKAIENHDPVIVSREDGEPFVMLSLQDFKGYEETAYLTKSPANRKRLLESVKNINKAYK